MNKKTAKEQIQSLVNKNLNLAGQLQTSESEKTEALAKLAQSKQKLKELRATIEQYRIKEKLFVALDSDNRKLKNDAKSRSGDKDASKGHLVCQILPEKVDKPETSSDAEIRNLRTKISQLEKVNNELFSQHQVGLSDNIGLRERITALQNQIIRKSPGQFRTSSSWEESENPENSSTDSKDLFKAFEVMANYR